MQGKRFETAADALSFIQAGNAIFTLVGRSSRFTYRVRESDDGKVFFVSVLTGTNNDGDYTYLGIIRNGEFRRTAKSRISDDAPSHMAFLWSYTMLGRGLLPDALQVWHEGRCGRCARTLTVPESIARGLGPECAGKFECKPVVSQLAAGMLV